MTTTSPDAIFYPSTSDTDGYQDNMATMAGSIQTALNARQGRTFRVADSAARTALSSTYTLRADDYAYQVDVDTTYRYDGSSWIAWHKPSTSWTPTTTNITMGSGGAASGKYRVVDGWCYYHGKIAFGTSPSISPGARHSLPLTPDSTWDDDVWMFEKGVFRDASIDITHLDGEGVMFSVFDPATGDVRLANGYGGAASSPADYLRLSKTATAYGTVASGDYITFEGAFPVEGAW